ncbi:putative RDD family membrane protein YckC [Ereboglobus sp. PH5-5]|uniref:RDD family protein n=1 Tax=unclassified Ereboglobus TaxID=2626932 RepID=UPI0024051CE3|nr:MULTISPECIES: RDD family protein [unclassified Ereboglobus]MDF9826616.1 putative RDD family membrane protein YckC [Ereboglobus sp. PH5-10]MDF9833520.1 putative RDD family membrane protein YckC [Ereboglobus sp. PH5-5]
MQWYYVLNGERVGPVSQEQFDQLAQAGTIMGETLVWHAGMAEWLPWAQTAARIAGESDSAVCAVSGRLYPKREMLEYQGRWVSAEHKDAFFQRIREGVQHTAMPGEMRYAGFWIRFAAVIIDMMCLWAINMVFSMGFMFVLMALGGIASASGSDGMTPVVLILQLSLYLVQFAVALAYDVFFIRKYDATPGKLALGLKILRADGEKLSVGRIIGRNFAKGVSALILCIGYIMAGWDEQKRALHDIICDTRVVRK